MENNNIETGASLPLPKERSLFFSREVDQESVEELTRQIVDINNNDTFLKKLYLVYDLEYKPKPIEIIIDSYGGDCYTAMGLIGIIKKSKTPIHTIVAGAAMSCGFMILIHGHRRFAHEYATPMYHQISSGFWGKIKDLEEDYSETKRLQKIFENMILKKTKIDKAKLKEILKGKKDWYMNSEEALELGVIDEII